MRIITKLRLNDLIDTLYTRLRSFAPAPGHDELLAPIALYYYNNEPQKAREAFALLHARDPQKFPVLQALLVLQQPGEADPALLAALERLKNLLPNGSCRNAILKELFNHTYNQDGLALDTLRTQDYHADDSETLLAHAVHATYPYLPCDALALSQPLLLLCSGPKVIFDLLYHSLLLPGQHAFDALCGQALREACSRLPLAGTIGAFPNKHFCFAFDYPKLAPLFPAARYAACIFFMSRFSTRDAGEIIELARTVTRGPVYFYVYDQIFSNTYRFGLFQYSES